MKRSSFVGSGFSAGQRQVYSRNSPAARPINKGNVVIMMGELATQATVLRTEGLGKTVSQHPADRMSSSPTMTKWPSEQSSALQQAGKDPTKVVIEGIDATADGLAEMEKRNLDVTVFQDAKGQGKGAVETAVKLIKGEKG
jgi:inositol transport system substrate-binding protein